MPPAIAVLSGPRLYSSAVPSYSFLTSTPAIASLVVTGDVTLMLTFRSLINALLHRPADCCPVERRTSIGYFPLCFFWLQCDPSSNCWTVRESFRF